MKEDKTFLNQTTFVCQECYLCITLSSESSGVKIHIPTVLNESSMERNSNNMREQKLRILKKQQQVDLSRSRPDIRRKDARAQDLTSKYSLSNIKEFKPLSLEYRS